MHFKIDRASLTVGSKFTVFALFYFVFDGNFPSASSGGEGGGVYIWKGDLLEGFWVTRLGAYTWRGLFSEIYGIPLILFQRKSAALVVP